MKPIHFTVVVAGVVRQPRQAAYPNPPPGHPSTSIISTSRLRALPCVSPRPQNLFVSDTAPRLAFLCSHSFDAMILQKYSRSVDGTIPVAALLYDEEENYASQDNVGIYDGYGSFIDLSPNVSTITSCLIPSSGTFSPSVQHSESPFSF